MTNFEKELEQVVEKKYILKNEPMSKHTSFKIGGKADYLVTVNSIGELKEVLNIAKSNNVKITVIGNGTNLLVTEAGIRGIVIKLNLKNFKVRNIANGAQITVEAGLSLASLSNIALKEELSGLEFLAGIPGSVGGAIRMNAGAFGKEMKDIVLKTRYITYDGKIKTLNSDEHKFEYRNSVFSEIKCIIVDTVIQAEKGKKEEIEAKIEEYSTLRKNNQPLEYPSAGSIFKRIEGVPTAKLIDDCGLKGFSIGGAEISTKHAGFIINKGNATAKDVLELANYVKKIVKEKFNQNIELEILVLGEKK